MIALARTHHEPMPEAPVPRAQLWLMAPGRPPVPLRAPPFSEAKFDRPEGRTDALLRAARNEAAQKSGREIGRGGPSHGPETDLQAAWDAAAAENGGVGPAIWTAPAHHLGLTELFVAKVYGVPLAAVQRAMRGAPPQTDAPAPQRPTIGRRDGWGVWFTTMAEADQLFARSPTGRTAADERDRSATRTSAAAKAASRYEERLARLQSQGRIA